MHMSTNMTPVSLVLLRRRPSQTTVSYSSSFTTDSFVETDSRWLRLNFQRKTAMLQGKANAHMLRRKAQFKHHHKKKIQFKPKHAPVQWRFVDRLQPTSGLNITDGMETISYNKIKPRKPRPFRIIEVQSSAAVIDKDNDHNTVPEHRITAALRPKSNNQWPRTGTDQQSDATQTAPKASCQLSIQTTINLFDRANDPLKYAVKEIFWHESHGQTRRYVTR